MGLQQWPVQTIENPDAITLRIGPPQTLLRTALEQARWAPDGRTLALVRGRNSDLKLVEADTGREWATLEAGEPHCFSPRGNWLVTSEANGLLRLWDLRRIRQQLATLKLDWDAPLGEPEKPFASEKPLKVTVDLGEAPAGQ
jgi:WD40 repeat protein